MSVFASPALVLNADFRPLSYYPLSLCSWQDTVKSVFLNRVSIIERYNKEVHSPSLTFKLPSVIALKDYVMPQRKPAFTRFNVFLRDNFTCQYCHVKFSANELTFDHLVPRCLRGKTSWNNVVSACTNCNLKKGRRLLKFTEMKLLKNPIRPSSIHLQNNGRNFPPNFLHESWRDYLYWDIELQN
jgi:5-methylcytosine-specific restriction endonuclease McrA|tara:strand:+ start:233 stop:787 length:555 start_codon:yes stop_codon:yes gene_type:complete